MELTTRISSSGFIEIKVDEIETTIFKDSEKEIENLIDNLISVADELAELGGITMICKLGKH